MSLSSLKITIPFTVRNSVLFVRSSPTFLSSVIILLLRGWGPRTWSDGTRIVAIQRKNGFKRTKREGPLK